MKTYSKFIFLLLTLFITESLKAQTGAGPVITYRRSSLAMILIESEDFPQKQMVINSYNKVPFPDKYNNHSITLTSFTPGQYPISAQDRAAAKIQADTSSADGKEGDMPIIIDKFITTHKIGNQLVAKWFGRKPNGAFDMSLIAERGQYDATEMAANIAKSTVRGTAALSDAGDELIGNTFVVFSKLNFVPNEPIVRVIRDIALIKASKLPGMVQMATVKAINLAYEKAKEGYSVWTTSYLYQLKWDDATANTFYTNFWMDEKTIDPAKKTAFDNTNLFKLEYVGYEKSSSLVTATLSGTRTQQQVIELSTIRNVDGVFAKLQKKFDVFEPKVPLFSGYPITAKIGMKEGLEGGERFEVLEQVVDQTSGLTQYKRKGVITVDKKALWDNRYNAADSTADATLTSTGFKGSKDYYSGMLIRQIK